MDYVLTDHARSMIEKRGIKTAWVKKTLSHPERVEGDRFDDELEHRLARIEDYGNRILRVIYNLRKD